MILAAATARGGTLYFTDFEEFTAGNNQWSQTGGWASNDNTSGAQGIIQDPVADLPLGKAGYLGFSRPATRFTSVFRSVNHDPVASNLPIIGFEALLGVQDSTNGRRDRFHISFYNTSGDFLAAVTFDNTVATMKRDDGVIIHDTGTAFLRGEPLLGLAALQILRIEIDFPSNVWSARIDGIPIFTEAPFTATGKTRTLGPVAAEWTVAAATTADAGNNWLLVADWLVFASPRDALKIDSILHSVSGETTITWAAHAGFDYQVFHSPSLETWHSDLQNSAFPKVAMDGLITFTDITQPTPPTRFYRIRRSPSR